MENAKCYAPQILVGTEGLPREQWLEYRRKGIGGSDAAAVLGISPFRTGRDLYYDKLNIVTADDAENWVQLEVGTLLEPLVAKIFAHKTGYKIYRRPVHVPASPISLDAGGSGLHGGAAGRYISHP